MSSFILDQVELLVIAVSWAVRWVASLWRAVASGGEQWRAVAASGAGEQAVAWMRRAGRGEWVAAGAGLSIKFAASVHRGQSHRPKLELA
eukprot:scaffold39695_cov67-Phaeocystis_antarctica.AAC.5